MSNKDNNILKYDHGEKSMKVPFIIYGGMEPSLEKINTCHNNPKEPSTTKINKHTPYGYSLLTHCSFAYTKNKLDYDRGEGRMKRFFKDLEEHATKITNYEEKEMIPSAYKENNSYKNQKVCYICKKKFITDNKSKECHKVRDHCHVTGKYRGAAHNICNLRYKIPKNIRLVFHDGSNYDYHFIIKELAKEFPGKFKCLRENTEKYITFSVPIKKNLIIVKELHTK